MLDMIQNTTTATAVDLSSRAMLVSLSVSQWSGRKLDKRVTREVNEAHNARADAGRYNKSLLASDALAEIKGIVTQARQDHIALTLPWMQDGTRILSADGATRYFVTMRQHREAFESARAAFVAAYPSYVDQARDELNGLFRDSDDPSAWEIQTKFNWSVNALPMPDVADFRVNIADDMADALRAEMAASLTDAVSEAMGDVWQRLHTAVSAMADKLTAFEPGEPGKRATGIFRDSLVENIRELVDILPGLNLTGDPAFAATIATVRDKLTVVDAADLRTDDAARDEVAKAATDIAADMAAFMGA